MSYILKTYILSLFLGSFILSILLSIKTSPIMIDKIILLTPLLIFYSLFISIIPLLVNLILVNIYSLKNKLFYIVGTLLITLITVIILSLLLDNKPYSFLSEVYYFPPYVISFLLVVLLSKFKINEY